ncbi:chaplin [Streptomyces sp. NBC_00199]|uniref:chaplin n=1 Tax=Streptomyces sp. NBC_00199 TaxID=2975678 RepID=UPI00225124FE|nr:chaplin [Streptomyces sp. NBC_00199]MCX5263967.1 chaplin [Streptomyces sp. NBC_00199]
MKRVTRTGVMAVAVVSGAMAVTLPAHADSAANGVAAGSPGLISGNGVQLPVHLPVNLCGNTVDVVGVLNPAAGNTCANKGGADASGGRGGQGAHSGHGGRGGHGEQGGHGEHGGRGGSGASSGGGATAQGDMEDSPGVVSGNGLQLPVQLPVNVSGNSVNVVGIGDPAFGNESVNISGEKPEQPVHRPPTRHTPPEQPQHPGPKANPSAPAVESGSRGPEALSSLAHTGADATLTALAGSSAMLLGGVLLYRRFRPGAER